MMVRLVSVSMVVLLTGCVSAPKEGESLSFYEGGFLKARLSNRPKN